jgi:hypothetical protein
MSKTGYDALMHEACVTWGYCGCIKRGQPLHVDLLIPPAGPVTADQFIEWLILADDVNPNEARHERMKTALRDVFIRTMGAETVDASLLRWSHAHAGDPLPDQRFKVSFLAIDASARASDSHQLRTSGSTAQHRVRPRDAARVLA